MAFVGATTAGNDHPTFSSNVLTSTLNWPAGTRAGDVAFLQGSWPAEQEIVSQQKSADWNLLFESQPPGTGSGVSRCWWKKVNSADLAAPALVSTENGYDDTINGVVVYRDLDFDSESHMYLAGASATASFDKLVAGGVPCVMIVSYASGLSGSGDKYWYSPTDTDGRIDRVFASGPAKAKISISEYKPSSTATRTFGWTGGATNNTLAMVIATKGYLWSVGSVASLVN